MLSRKMLQGRYMKMVESLHAHAMTGSAKGCDPSVVAGYPSADCIACNVEHAASMTILTLSKHNFDRNHSGAEWCYHNIWMVVT